MRKANRESSAGALGLGLSTLSSFCSIGRSSVAAAPGSLGPISSDNAVRSTLRRVGPQPACTATPSSLVIITPPSTRCLDASQHVRYGATPYISGNLSVSGEKVTLPVSFLGDASG